MTSEIKTIGGELSSVIYQFSNNTYRFNLTKMAKPFGKLVGHWRRLKETQEFINALQRILNRYPHVDNVENLIYTKQGGNPTNLEQGTWTSNWQIAMNFAQWLSPEFGIWCNDIIGRIVFGSLLSVGDDIKIIDGKTYISRDGYCKSTEASHHSFNGLKGNYASEFAVVDGVYYMTTDLANAQKQQLAATKVKSDIRQKAVATSDGSVQLAIEFKD